MICSAVGDVPIVCDSGSFLSRVQRTKSIPRGFLRLQVPHERMQTKRSRTASAQACRAGTATHCTGPGVCVQLSALPSSSVHVLRELLCNGPGAQFLLPERPGVQKWTEGEKLESNHVQAYPSSPASHKACSAQRLGVSHTISPRGGSSDGGFVFHKTKTCTVLQFLRR